MSPARAHAAQVRRYGSCLVAAIFLVVAVSECTSARHRSAEGPGTGATETPAPAGPGPLRSIAVGEFGASSSNVSPREAVGAAFQVLENTGAASVRVLDIRPLATSGVIVAGVLVADPHRVSTGIYDFFPPDGYPRSRFFAPSRYRPLRHRERVLVVIGLKRKPSAVAGTLGGFEVTYEAAGKNYSARFPMFTLLCAHDDERPDCASAIDRTMSEWKR
jgi:hypothetical protein